MDSFDLYFTRFFTWHIANIHSFALYNVDKFFFTVFHFHSSINNASWPTPRGMIKAFCCCCINNASCVVFGTSTLNKLVM